MATHPAPYNIFEPGESSKQTNLNTTPASSIYTIYSLPSSNPSPTSESPPFPNPQPPSPRNPYTTPPSATYTLPAPPTARPRAVGPPAVRYPRRVATAAGGSRYMHLRELEDGGGDGDDDGLTWRTEGRIGENMRSTILAIPVPKLKPVVQVFVAEYQGLRLCAISDAVPWLLSPLSIPIRLQAILEDGPRFPAPLCHPAHRYTHTPRDKALLALLTSLDGRRERGNWYAQGLAIRGGKLVLYRRGGGDGKGGVGPLGVDSGMFEMWAEEEVSGKGKGKVEEEDGDVEMFKPSAFGSGSRNKASSVPPPHPQHPQHPQHIRPENTQDIQLTPFPQPERSIWSKRTPARTEEGRVDAHEPAQARWWAGVKTTTRKVLLWTFVSVVCTLIIGGIIWGLMGVMVRRD
ncbi:hypothetical protein Ptr86124_011170 [Pyrenophora tritici-repentis]|uniref:Uncharacterized protein n=1 Tax=Pyrenophora tritici-repentis TaxID=45151 RepID=A0A922SX35_9PLEO|nr:hypothetical protein Ptr86124_011170 [Pyrenophora tritici-repentis]